MKDTGKIFSLDSFKCDDCQKMFFIFDDDFKKRQNVFSCTYCGSTNVYPINHHLLSSLECKPSKIEKPMSWFTEDRDSKELSTSELVKQVIAYHQTDSQVITQARHLAWAYVNLNHNFDRDYPINGIAMTRFEHADENSDYLISFEPVLTHKLIKIRFDDTGNLINHKIYELKEDLRN